MLDNKKKDKKMKNKFFSLFLAMVLVFSFSIVYISVRGDINKDNKSIHSISTIKPSIVVEKMVRTTTSNWKENVSQYICGIVRFNITICNVGTYYLFDITVNDRIPGNLLYIGNATVDGEPFEPNVDDMNLTWFLLPHEKYPIGPGGSRYIEFDARVKASGTGTNIVEVDAFEEGETEPLSVHANDTSNVTGINHGIVVKKMIWNGDNWSERVDAKPGDIVTFNITVNNTGNVDFNDTSIVDMLPVSMFEYVHNSAKVNGVVQNPEVKEANLTWYNDSLLPFEKIEVIFNALFIKSNIGENINQILVTGFINDIQINVEDEAIINGLSADVYVEKKIRLDSDQDWQDEINAWIGDILRFNITIDNTNGNLFNVWINDTLPNNLLYMGNSFFPDHYMDIFVSSDNKSVKWHCNGFSEGRVSIEFDTKVVKNDIGVNRVDVIAQRLGEEKHWSDAATVFSTAFPQVKITNPSTSFVNKLQNITGEVLVENTNISSLNIQIFNQSDNIYWNGIGWQKIKIWLNVSPVDGIWDNENEEWFYNSSIVTWMHTSRYKISIKVLDEKNREGNISSSFLFDIEKPTTSHSLDPTEPGGEKGWYISDVNIALNATDNNVSGIKETKYIINKGLEKTYESPITISADGIYNVKYFSIDNATNKEPIRNIPPFKIDRTPPSTECSKDGWFNESIVEVKLITEDRTSGINKTFYRIDNLGEWKIYHEETLEITGEGNHIIEYYSIDESGNKEKNKNCSIGIDITKPLINIKKPKEKYLYLWDREIRSIRNRLTRILGPLTLSVDAYDEYSGIEKVEFYICDFLNREIISGNDTIEPFNWTWNQQQLVPRKYTIKVVAYDNANNKITSRLRVMLVFNLGLLEVDQESKLFH